MTQGNTVGTVRFLAVALIQLLIQPVQFFTGLPENVTASRVWGFLTASACFYSLATLLTRSSFPPAAASAALVLAATAAGTVTAGALAGYGAMAMICKTKRPFLLVLGIYVFASGMTWLVAWLPLMLWLTEPWRWWLMGKGLCVSCGLTGRQAAGVMCITVPVQWAGGCVALGAFTG